MNNPTRKHMDIASPRPAQVSKRQKALTTRQKISLGLVVLVLALLAWTSDWLIHKNELRVDTNQYQAVFLDNDQVFFGKLQNTHGEYLTLKNAYYVKSGEQSSTDGQNAVSQPVSTQLVKVSDSVYGPDDTMSIQSSKVLFWQNLKDNSKVAEAINKQK
jgi:hypothetical protein